MGTPRKPDTPEKAIRLKCLECCCGEVEQCGLTGCPLYDFRMYGVKKSEELAAKTPDEIIEPISKVDTGTGTICGEPPVIAETVKPIKVKATKENIVMSEASILPAVQDILFIDGAPIYGFQVTEYPNTSDIVLKGT